MININFSAEKQRERKEDSYYLDIIKKYESTKDKSTLSEIDINLYNYTKKMLSFESFSDVFYEYACVMKELSEEYPNHFISDTMNIDPTKVIVDLGFNPASKIKLFSDCDAEEDEIAYGVCDNASQVLEKRTLADDEILVLTPVVKGISLNWRWHKWGTYIGVQKSDAEYIDHETNIDFVYVYHILKIIPANK